MGSVACRFDGFLDLPGSKPRALLRLHDLDMSFLRYGHYRIPHRTEIGHEARDSTTKSAVWSGVLCVCICIVSPTKYQTERYL